MSLSLRNATTKELVEELRKREGVETCFVGVEDQYEVQVLVPTTQNASGPVSPYGFRQGGMHNRTTGPAIVLVVID